MLRARSVFCVVLTITLGATVTPAWEDPEGFFLGGEETIVFLGDSITQNGTYIDYVESFLATRFPQVKFRIHNIGLSSETVSGTSEVDHDPPRPFVHDRFARDVVPLAPDVVVVCYGMNDGNYSAFDEDRFRAYRRGVRLLVRRIRNETGARVTFLTPPPFDAERRRVSDPDAKHDGYKNPHVGYDDVLAGYSKWLLGLRAPRWQDGLRLVVGDVHGLTNRHLERRRRDRQGFYLAGDAVHPNATGHWLIAQALLNVWDAPPTCAEASIDAVSAKPLSGAVRNVRRSGESGVVFQWTTHLPMPFDSDWDEDSIALEDVSSRWSRYRLQVSGLPASREQELVIDGESAGKFSSSEWARGIDLNSLKSLAPVRTAREVVKLVRQRRRLLDGHWRKHRSRIASAGDARSVRGRAAAIAVQIRELCRPRAYRVEIR
ncbi:MAG: SGNH/GDSL hydrolase family protein [Planctomycetota bacterium]